MPTDDIGFRIRMLSNLINRRINQMIAEEETSLTAHQSWILDYLTLHKDQEIMQRDIEKNFSIRRSTASHMLQLMEKNGYISRVPVPKDARMKKLVITEKGMEAQVRMNDRIRRFENMLQSDMPTQELEYLKLLLKKLENNIL